MADKKYNIQENDMLKVEEPTADYGVTIQIKVPTMGNYSLEALTNELTEFAKKLILNKSKSSDMPKRYSSKLCHLREMSQNNISAEDINNDERLEYLLNK